MMIRRIRRLGLLLLLIGYLPSVSATDHLPPYKVIEVGVRSYLLVLDAIRLTKRQTQHYLVTQQNEPPNFANQMLGIYVKNGDWPSTANGRIAEKIDETVIAIRIFDVATDALLFEYRGPIFRRKINEKEDYGLISGAWFGLPDGGINYIRRLDAHDQYRFDHYYTIFGIGTPFRKRIPQRIEFSIVEPMAKDALFDGSVMLVISGGIGK